MDPLSKTERDFIKFWKGYLLVNKHIEYVRPVLIFYLMTEMLIKRTNQLPEKIRPARPTEDALFTIGATSGGLCKWRKKWKSIWESIEKEL